MTGPILWVVLGVAALLAAIALGYVVSVFNSLVQVRNNVDKAWENISVLLQQRHDELPKLVDTCMGYMKHEREVLTDITKLRTSYYDARAMQDKVQAENELNRKLQVLGSTWEGYPDLKANASFLQIQGRISAIESSIADRREFFNDSVNIFNIQIERFPERVVAGALGYKRHAFLEVPEEKKQDVKMKFS